MAGLTRLNARINRRRLIAASGGAVLGASALGAISPLAAQDAIIATLVTDTAGIGDQNFNDLANAGGERAAEELGVDFRVIESQTAADYEPNLTLGLEQGDIVAAIGFLLVDAVNVVAPQFPDKSVVHIDAESTQPNVLGYIFREHEGAFLGGVLAGLFSTSGRVGMVGGQRIPPVIKYEVGFAAGAMTVNPDVVFTPSYADDFEDPALGKELTLALFEGGVDVVMQAAGRTGIGCFDAAKEKGPGFWVVAGDTDQAHLGPDNQLGYVRKGVDNAVFDAIKAKAEGSFEGGTQNLGIVEGGMDFAGFHASVDQSIIDTVMAYRQAIIDGVVTVPATDEEFATFTPAPLDGMTSPSASPAATPAT